MIKNIIFDFDGVLVDSEKLVGRAFAQYLVDRNIPFSEEEFALYAGKKTIHIIQELSVKFNIENQKNFFDDIMKIALDIFVNELTPVPGAENFLKNSNCNFFIGSNSMKERILIGLKKVNFESYFKEDKIFSFDMVSNPKPEPDVYLKVIETYKLNKDETIIIEDSAVGVTAGVKAGVKVIGFTAGGHWFPHRSQQELLDAGADLIIDNYIDLSKKIKDL